MTRSELDLRLTLRSELAFPLTTGRGESEHCIVIGVYANGLTDTARSFDEATQGFLGRLLARGDFDPRPGKVAALPEMLGRHTHVLLAGLGDERMFDSQAFARAAKAVANGLMTGAASHIVWPLWQTDDDVIDDEWGIRQCALALHEAAYLVPCDGAAEDASPAPKPGMRTIEFVVADAVRETHREALCQGEAIGRGVTLCRQLGDLPGNVCTPGYLADVATRMSRPDVLTVDVLDEAQIGALGMNAFLSVAAGSDEPARLIVMSYRGTSTDQAPVVLIGKGVTFDAGGISLKPAKDMDQMKFDMCGAAAVMGALHAAAEMSLDLNVVCLVAATENLPGGRATKPGDVVRSLSGKTIEILNTDAEGRLLLCDVLTYARQFDPTVVIDVATLTGACITALGHAYSGLFSRDDALAADLVAAGGRAIDPVWRMPLDGPFEDELTSKFADLANIGSGVAGSALGATFLSRFAQGYAWAHLDVAGTASRGGKEKGATGRPVPLLVEFLMSYARRETVCLTPAPEGPVAIV